MPRGIKLAAVYTANATVANEKLAAMQKPFLQHLELVPPDAQTDEMQTLLKEALNYIVFIPWSAGVMTEFEYELYANNLPREEFNSKWWELSQLTFFQAPCRDLEGEIFIAQFGFAAALQLRQWR